MKTSCGILIGLLFCHVTFAKAPIVENHSLSKISRIPAQTNAIGIKALEYYMDASCSELIAQSESDRFSRYLKKEFKKLDPDFCSLVGDFGGEESFAQAQQDGVGLGTFSKLVEGHYREYAQGMQLEYFQDMNCFDYMESSEEGNFVAYFKNHLTELDSEICSKVGNFEGEIGSGKIGLGTYSKMVESAFWEYNRKTNGF